MLWKILYAVDERGHADSVARPKKLSTIVYSRQRCRNMKT